MSASLRRIVAKREDREGTEDLPLMDVPSVYYTRKNKKEEEERYKELNPIGFGHISSPEAKANIFSRITFWWANRLPLFASKYILEIEHLWNVLDKDNSRSVFLSVDKEWQKQKQLPKPSFGRALWKVYKWYFIRCLIFMLISLAAQMAIPELLSRLITWTAMKRANAPNVHPYAGWIYAGGMFLLAEFGSLCQHQAAYNCVRVGSALRVAVVTSVYRHSVRLSNRAKRNTSHGNIVNIMSNDAQRLVDVCLFLPNVIVGPIQLIVATTLLYFKMGWTTFVALGYIALAMTICFLVARRMDRYRFGIVENADARVKITTEIIQYIKVIKLYAWENSFAQRVIQSRISEIMYMRTYNALRATVASFTSSCVPISTILMYSAYWAFGNELTAAVVFSSLSYINSLATPLNYVSPLAMQVAQVRVALTRITRFLMQEEITPVDDIHDPETNAVIKVAEADFDWDTKTPAIDGKSKYPDFTLRNLNLHLRGPQLVAVVGSIGSGKSSLITSILGEMKRLKGDLNRKGTVAYVPQQAWITNATIRENITFGYPYDEKYYNTVLDACALFSDLKILSAGDQTEIGDRGVNLSGGQKQRISVARALYTRADIYILDDPLSAVDAHVAKHMFYNAFKRILSNKLVVLVTNQLQFLPDVDYVVVLGKDGHTLCQGKFGELTSSNSEFAAMMETFGGGSQRAGEHEQESQKNGVDKISGNGELVKSEARERGSVRLRVYFEYLKSGGLFHAVFILLFYCAQIGSNSFLNWWLSYWTSNQKVTHRPTYFYFSIYAGIGGFLVLAAAIRAFLFYFYTPKASLKVHNRLFNRVIHLPMSYFDVTPLGRIINRFSKDIDIIDTSLPGMLDTTCLFSINLIASLCMIIVVIPIILSIIAPCVIVYAIVQVFYRNTSREIQRIEAITRSAIFAHFSESLHGASSIRAYGCSERMIATNERLLDSNLKAYFTLQAMEQWLGVRLDFIANIVIFGTATFVILFRDGITPGEIGLALSYSLSITTFLNRATLSSCDLETKMNSVERILESCELKIEPRNAKAQDDPNWPSTGDIQFNNFKMRYRHGLDYVLRGLTFNIKTKEKIGIVGRTGAGKSSIVLALFRLVEAAEGNIRLDNVDISQLELHTLRSRIAIIPQDPVLFSGTLRDNLDPFHTLEDSEIWKALDSIQLRGAAERAGGLDSTVSENGDNWSVGQRQLICLCRALLRKPKILVLDEASASVDTATDNLIQKTIREEFKEATILTIAHRLNTIMDSSRIIVMDNGMISEFDTPAKLLDNPKSHLNWLVNETGPKNAEVLRNMAYGKLN